MKACAMYFSKKENAFKKIAALICVAAMLMSVPFGYKTEFSVKASDAPKINLTSFIEDWRLTRTDRNRMEGWDSAKSYIKISSEMDDIWGGGEYGGRGRAYLIDGLHNPAVEVPPRTQGYFITDGKSTAADTLNEWIQINLKKKYEVSKFLFYGLYQTAEDKGVPVDFTIDVSTDGTNWDTVKTVTANTVSASPYSFEFSPAEARYVRMNVTAVNSNLPGVNDSFYEVVLSEIEVYGEELEDDGEGEYPKIDLTPYVAGMSKSNSNISNFPQDVVTASRSYEHWNHGRAVLIDGMRIEDEFFTAVNSTDGIINTPPSGPLSPSGDWVKLDLQQKYFINKYGFASWGNASPAGLPVQFTIEVSVDNINWDQVYAQTSDLPVVGNWYEFEFEETQARYVRMSVTKFGTPGDLGDHMCLKEIEVYGVPVEKPPTTSKISVPNDKVTVSRSLEKNGLSKSNLVDGDDTTGFSAINESDMPGIIMDEWIQMDMQSSYRINKIRLASYANSHLGGFPTVFDIHTSEDGENWTMVKSVDGVKMSDADSPGWFTFSFSNTQARYVRINVFDIGGIGEGSLGYAIHLREFEVYRNTGSKINLTSYVPDLNDWYILPQDPTKWASGYQQNVVTASNSYELWGWGISTLIDGRIDGGFMYACAPTTLTTPLTGMNDTVTVDFNAAYKLDKFRFATMESASLAGMPIEFKLEISLDGSLWRTVVSKTGLTTSDGSGRWYEFKFPLTEATRYVRMTVTRVGADSDAQRGYCMTLNEIEYYGIFDENAQLKPDGWGKIDLTKALMRASQSYNSWGHGIGNLYNGNQTGNLFIAVSLEDANYYTRFHQTNPERFKNECDEYIKIRLDGIYSVDMLRFQSWWAGNAAGVPKHLKIEASMVDDKGSYTLVYEQDDQDLSSSDWYGKSFDPVECRFLRISFRSVIDACDLGYVPALKELELYGTVKTLDKMDLDVEPPDDFLLGQNDSNESPSETGDNVLFISPILLICAAGTALLAARKKRRG